jgi:hypothetical protein
MVTKTKRVDVNNAQAMEQAITSYIAQGFSVVNKTATSATLYKKKDFSIFWAVVGFLICIIPLFIYLIYYVTQSDEMVEIVVRSAEA